MRKRNVAAAIVVVVAAWSAVSAAQTGDTGVIRGCVSPSGQIRVLGDGGSCKDNETPLDWNMAGPAGPAGADGVHCWDVNENGVPDADEDVNADGSVGRGDCVGPEGPQGDPGEPGEPGTGGGGATGHYATSDSDVPINRDFTLTRTTVLTRQVAAGSYVANASIELEAGAGTNGAVAECALVVGTTERTVRRATLTAPAKPVTLALSAPITLADTGAVTVACWYSHLSEIVVWADTYNLTLTKVASVSNL